MFSASTWLLLSVWCKFHHLLKSRVALLGSPKGEYNDADCKLDAYFVHSIHCIFHPWPSSCSAVAKVLQNIFKYTYVESASSCHWLYYVSKCVTIHCMQICCSCPSPHPSWLRVLKQTNLRTNIQTNTNRKSSILCQNSTAFVILGFS